MFTGVAIPERRRRFFDSLLEARLDGDVGVGAGLPLAVDGHGRVRALVSGLRGLEYEAEGAVVVEERLHAVAVRHELLLVLQPLDLCNFGSCPVTMNPKRSKIYGNETQSRN